VDDLTYDVIASVLPRASSSAKAVPAGRLGTAMRAAITSRSNERVKRLRAAFTGGYRTGGDESTIVAVEGEHLIKEAVRSGLRLQAVFLSEGYRTGIDLPADVESVLLAEDVFRSAVITEAPQGIAALVHLPKQDDSVLDQPEVLALIAVGLQDPGNLGTLIRSADAFGATCVVTTPGTVSPWNQKAMRASAGSVFRVPLLSLTLQQVRELVEREGGLGLIAAVARGGMAPRDMAVEGACGLLIGNEGAGLSDDWLALAHGRVTISCPGAVESLNAAVAGSLLLYECSLQRQRT
jgi:TrmH family RNA methyltransferase